MDRDKTNKSAEELIFTDEDMELLARYAEKSLEDENLPYEKKVADTSQNMEDEPDREILAMIRAKDKERSKAIRYRRLNRIARFAAVFLICVITVGAIGMSTSEAFRTTVFNLFNVDAEDPVFFRDETEEQLLKGEGDYWYPEYMTEGFEITSIKKIQEGKILTYESKNDQSEIEVVSQHVPYIIEDEDFSQLEKFKLGNYTGYLVLDEANDWAELFWQVDDVMVSVSSDGLEDKEELVKIAESTRYIE